MFNFRYVSPKNMIFTSIAICIGAAAMLCILSGSSVIGLFIGTGILGFGIATQFPR